VAENRCARVFSDRSLPFVAQVVARILARERGCHVLGTRGAHFVINHLATRIMQRPKLFYFENETTIFSLRVVSFSEIKLSVISVRDARDRSTKRDQEAKSRALHMSEFISISTIASDGCV